MYLIAGFNETKAIIDSRSLKYPIKKSVAESPLSNVAIMQGVMIMSILVSECHGGVLV